MNQTLPVRGTAVLKDCRPQYAKDAVPLSKREKTMLSVGQMSTLETTCSGSAKKQTQQVRVNQNHSANEALNASNVSANTSISYQPTGGIVKTVILPYDEIINLKSELENLKMYKIAQKSLFEEAIQGYQKDKIIRLKEQQLKSADFEESIAFLKQRLNQREEEGYSISKDYFQYKHEVQKSKDTLDDERELLLIERRALEDQFNKLKGNSITDKEYAVDLYNQKTDNFAQRFRKQAQKNENDLKVIKAQYE